MVFGKTINQLTVARQLRNYTSFPFNYLQVNKPRQGKCTTILSEQQVVAKLYPNPNNGEFNLAYDLKTTTEATLQITDVTGKLVYTGSIDNLNNLVQLNTKYLQAGIYFVQLIHDKQLLWTDKLIISK